MFIRVLLILLFSILLVARVDAESIAPQSEGIVLGVETSSEGKVAFHTRPGLVSYKGGKWVGNEYLLGLSEGIRIVVEIIKPERVNLGITSERLRARAEMKVREVGVDPLPKSSPRVSVLPFLHILVLIYPVEEGYAASCNVRLFENVELPRVSMKQAALWQAITWEQQTLLVFPEKVVGKRIEQSVTDILEAFTKRYAFYLRLQKYIQQKKA